MLKNVSRDLTTNQQISSKMRYIAGISERHEVVTEAWCFLNKNLLDLKKEVLLVIFKEVGDMYTWQKILRYIRKHSLYTVEVDVIYSVID